MNIILSNEQAVTIIDTTLMNKELNEAAEKCYQEKYFDNYEVKSNSIWFFKAGALSDAAKEYWYAQWQAEQKQQ